MTDPVEALAAALAVIGAQYDPGGMDLTPTVHAALRASGFDVVPTGDAVLQSAYDIALKQIEHDGEVINRLKQALRVNTHSPHDQNGEPIEGFPVCSVCGAIQTDVVPTGDALPRHLDFCSGGEFCSLDDCLCDCHRVPTGDAGLDAERLARAMSGAFLGVDPNDEDRELARLIAAEYARLSSSDTGGRG